MEEHQKTIKYLQKVNNLDLDSIENFIMSEIDRNKNYIQYLRDLLEDTINKYYTIIKNFQN